MKRTLLPHLICPQSGRKLTLQGEDLDGDEIVGGVLVAGKHRYPIIHGVPCFLTPDQQALAKEEFTPMWQYRQQGAFERENVYGIRPGRKAVWVEDQYESAIAASEWVLDAGCGSAEMTHVLATRHPKTHVVGLEFSDAVRLAARGSAAIDNLHFVQADIAHPPFKRQKFGHVLSLGVLHHTPDTREALAGAAAMVAPGGEVLLWLYPAKGQSFFADQLYTMRDRHFMGVGHKIPPDWRLKAAKLYSLGMMPGLTAFYSLYKIASKFGGKAEDKVISEDMSVKDLYRTTTFAVFDNISPEHQHRHTTSDIQEWLVDLGFEQIETDGRGLYTARKAAVSAVRVKAQATQEAKRS